MKISPIISFIKDSTAQTLKGTWRFYSWSFFLCLFIIIGAYCYTVQLKEGLIVTGMNDHVSWGLYISNFTFLVGLAAAAVMLVLPAYVLKDKDFSNVVLIGEGLAVSALIMCLCFVTVDMGQPLKLWHMIPKIGIFNFPNSMLTWDVIVLNGYLALNFSIPAYILYCKYMGKKPNRKLYVPLMYLSVSWAVCIHLVTAFLYSALPARPFWNNALLGPRFLASAFSAGPAFMILALMFIKKSTAFNITDAVFKKLSLIVVIAAQINIIMLVSEIFKEFYWPTHHSISARYLFFGLEGHRQLVPWIWTGICLNVVSTLVLTVHRFRSNHLYLSIACALLFIGISIEKGLGLIVPGFIPSPLGEIVEYTPTAIEIFITIGIWSLGLFVFTILVKISIPIELGKLRYSKKDPEPKPELAKDKISEKEKVTVN
jgi:molybdopterin-containing oxidoreductase family membrane subunit